MVSLPRMGGMKSSYWPRRAGISGLIGTMNAAVAVSFRAIHDARCWARTPHESTAAWLNSCIVTAARHSIPCGLLSGDTPRRDQCVISSISKFGVLIASA